MALSKKQVEGMQVKELVETIALMREVLATKQVGLIDETKERLKELAAEAGFDFRDLGIRELSTKAARFRDPKSGQTWTGRGAKPKWIQPFLTNKKLVPENVPAEYHIAAAKK